MAIPSGPRSRRTWLGKRRCHLIRTRISRSLTRDIQSCGATRGQRDIRTMLGDIIDFASRSALTPNNVQMGVTVGSQHA